MHNFVNFNDLFNRINILEEANNTSSAWKSAIKKSGLASSLKSYKNQKTGQGVGASSRTKNLILLRALYHKDFLSDDLFDVLRRKATSSTFIANEIQKADPEAFNKLFFSHTDVNEAGEEVEMPAQIDIVLQDIKTNPKRYLDVQLTNIMGKDYKQEVDVESDPPVTSKVAEIDSEIGEVVDDLYGEYFDERYIVEIQVADPNDAVKIKSKVEPFADEDGVDIVSRNGFSLVSFSFASDSESTNARELADKVKEIGVQQLYDLLTQDVERFTDRFEIYITEPGSVDIQSPSPAANRATQDRSPFNVDTPPPVDQSPDTFELEDQEVHIASVGAADRFLKKRGIEDAEGAKFDATKSDLNDDGKISEYERKRGKAIASAMGKKGGEDQEDYIPDDELNPYAAQSRKDRQAELKSVKDFVAKRSASDTRSHEDKVKDLNVKMNDLLNKIKYYKEQGDYTTASSLTSKYFILKGKMDHLTGENEGPVIESYTTQYLSEQKHKDRLLKPKQKSISFKDKMKPKTNWQLEELRGYGL